MKRTIVFFLLLIIISYLIGDLNHRVGYTPLTVVINTTFLLSVVYISSIISVKDIQKLMEKQKRNDRRVAAMKGGD